MKALGVLAITWPLLVVAAGNAPAAGAPATLTDAEQEMLEKLLGPGVMGEAVGGRTLTPAFASLHDGTWTYQIVSGKAAGETEQHVVTRLDGDPSGASWRYAAGTAGTVFIKQLDDGSLTFLSEEDPDQGVISRYQPAEPGLLAGLDPGDSRRSSIAVKVSDLSSPQVVSHEGTLDVIYSYIGAYKVTTPAGAYDAALIKWSYKGKVGPADVDDTQYRFFVENVGMVASVDKLAVSALFVFHEHSKFGKLLALTPQ